MPFSEVRDLVNTPVNISKQIYSRLQDDISKCIFENNLLYSMTGNIDFLKKIIALSHNDVYNECLSKVNSVYERFGRGIIIYGAGYIGQGLLCVFDDIAAFCDRDPEKQKNGHCGYPVISPSDLLYEPLDSAIVIAVIDHTISSEIKSSLIEMGIKEERLFECHEIFPLYSDYRIKLLDEQYFDPEFIKPIITKNETFIDAGCWNLYTSKVFARHCNNEYKRIIAFEPSPRLYPICIENSADMRDTTVYQSALWNEACDISFEDAGSPGSSHISASNHKASTAKAVKLDDVLAGEEATFIKMDIEGAELNALKGAKQTILKYRPKLAICVYHKPEDVLEIPSYILSLHDDYRLYLRHYSLWHGETILYAV